MWRLIKLGYQHEPGLLVFAVVVTVLNAIPDSLLALWLMLLADGVADGDDRQVMLSASASPARSPGPGSSTSSPAGSSAGSATG